MSEKDEVRGQSDNVLLIQLVKDVAALTASFNSFEKDRSEDNVALKESIEKVDRKVDGLDIKLEKMRENYDTKIGELQKAPLKDKADKFERYSRLIVETLIAACLVIILAKIGLK
jgi:hypothetical protein